MIIEINQHPEGGIMENNKNEDIGVGFWIFVIIILLIIAVVVIYWGWKAVSVGIGITAAIFSAVIAANLVSDAHDREIKAKEKEIADLKAECERLNRRIESTEADKGDLKQRLRDIHLFFKNLKPETQETIFEKLGMETSENDEANPS